MASPPRTVRARARPSVPLRARSGWPQGHASAAASAKWEAHRRGRGAAIRTDASRLLDVGLRRGRRGGRRSHLVRGCRRAGRPGSHPAHRRGKVPRRTGGARAVARRPAPPRRPRGLGFFFGWVGARRPRWWRRRGEAGRPSRVCGCKEATSKPRSLWMGGGLGRGRSGDEVTDHWWTGGTYCRDLVNTGQGSSRPASDPWPLTSNGHFPVPFTHGSGGLFVHVRSCMQGCTVRRIVQRQRARNIDSRCATRPSLKYVRFSQTTGCELHRRALSLIAAHACCLLPADRGGQGPAVLDVLRVRAGPPARPPLRQRRLHHRR